MPRRLHVLNLVRRRRGLWCGRLLGGDGSGGSGGGLLRGSILRRALLGKFREESHVSRVGFVSRVVSKTFPVVLSTFSLEKRCSKSAKKKEDEGIFYYILRVERLGFFFDL